MTIPLVCPPTALGCKSAHRELTTSSRLACCSAAPAQRAPHMLAPAGSREPAAGGHQERGLGRASSVVRRSAGLHRAPLRGYVCLNRVTNTGILSAGSRYRGRRAARLAARGPSRPGLVAASLAEIPPRGAPAVLFSRVISLCCVR